MDHMGYVTESSSSAATSDSATCAAVTKPRTPDYESSNRRPSRRRLHRVTKHGGRSRTIRNNKGDRLQYRALDENASDDSASDVSLPPTTTGPLITSQTSGNSEGSPPGLSHSNNGSKQQSQRSKNGSHNQYSSDYTKEGKTQSIERPPNSMMVHHHTPSHSSSLGAFTNPMTHHHDSQSSGTFSSPTRPITNIKFAELTETHSMGYALNDSRYGRSGMAFDSHPIRTSKSVGPQGVVEPDSESEETENSGRDLSCESSGNTGAIDRNDISASRSFNNLSRGNDFSDVSDRYDSFEISKLLLSPDHRFSVPPRPRHFKESHSLPIEEFGRTSLPTSLAKSYQFSHFGQLNSLNFNPNIDKIVGPRSVPNSFKVDYHELHRIASHEQRQSVREDIPAALQQMIAIKTLDAPKQIIVILDSFLSDYRMYQDRLNGNSYTAWYLSENNIIDHLMYAWNMGVEKMNCTLIALAIMSLCKFTHRNDFRPPFLSNNGIRLIGKTLSIPALKTSNTGNSSPRASSKKKVTMLMSVTSMDSIEFPTFSFGHILAVLKIMREICKEEVIDGSMWLSSKIHQKVLSTMKRDFDEPRITKACRNTLNALLDVSYEIGEAIINDEQIHDMIDLFVESTTREHVHSRISMKQELSNIEESRSARNTPGRPRGISRLSLGSYPNSNVSYPTTYMDPFSPLSDPLFSNSTNTITFSVATPEMEKPPCDRPRHRKKKNLFELERTGKIQSNPSSARSRLHDDHTHDTSTRDRSRTFEFTATSDDVEDHDDPDSDRNLHRVLSNLTDNNSINGHGGDDEMSDDDHLNDNGSEEEGSVIKHTGTGDTFSNSDETEDVLSVPSPRSITMPVPREVDIDNYNQDGLPMAIVITTSDHPHSDHDQVPIHDDMSNPSNPSNAASVAMGSTQSQPIMPRISGSHSRLSVMSDGTDATNHTAIHRPDSARSQSSTTSIMSLTEYDRMYAEALALSEVGNQESTGKSRKSSRGSVEIMAEIMEVDEQQEVDGNEQKLPSDGYMMEIMFGGGYFNDSDEEKSHTVKTSPISVLGEAALHSLGTLHQYNAMEARDINLHPHQLLYINCLFHILYKIITLTRSSTVTTQRRPASARTPHISFKERLKNEKRKRQVSNTVSGDTVGFLSNMDSAYFSSKSADHSKLNSRGSKLKNLNHGQNKLLEIFFKKRSFLNLFKVLKCYKLTTNLSIFDHHYDNPSPLDPLHSHMMGMGMGVDHGMGMNGIGGYETGAFHGFMADQVDPYHSEINEIDALGVGVPFGAYSMSKNKSSSTDSEDESQSEKTKMVSVVMLGCKILRKVLDYSQVITDKLLDNTELDIIGLLVNLLLNNNMNIDLNIYILDIMGRMTEMEDVRELLLSPEYFDDFLRALDPWWHRFLNASKKMSESLRGDVYRLEQDTTVNTMDSQETPNTVDTMDQSNIYFAESRMHRILSTNSIGVVGKVETMDRSRSAVETELHISVTIAMLKFFNELSKTNPLDIVEYCVNERILVLLDFYLNVSLTHDKIEQNETHSFDDLEWDMEMATNYKFVFSDKKHEECLMLCLECIQNLATDINMLLEFVVSKTCEKLSRICWSFRDNPSMIKTCCAVIAKLLKLEQSCEEVQAKKQDVLSPLIAVCKHIFKTAYFEHGPRDWPDLMIADTLYPEQTRHRQMERHFMQQQRDHVVQGSGQSGLSSSSPISRQSNSPFSAHSSLPPAAGRKVSVEPQLAPILEPQLVDHQDRHRVSYSISNSGDRKDNDDGNDVDGNDVDGDLNENQIQRRGPNELLTEIDVTNNTNRSHSNSINGDNEEDGGVIHVDTPQMKPLAASNSSEESVSLRKGLTLTMPGIQESARNSKENSREISATPSPRYFDSPGPQIVQFVDSQSAPTVDHRVRFDTQPAPPAPPIKSSTFSMYSSNVASPTSSFGQHLADLRDLFNVFIKISCVDEFCVEMVGSDIMPILLECISNTNLQLHCQPMTSLNFSDFMLSLTKNRKGRMELLRSTRFDVTLHIANAIGNNINNRGVVMKYLYALLNLKATDRKLLRSKLRANGGMEFLLEINAPMTYKDAFSTSLRSLLRDEESEDESDYVK